jgi:polysaccharide biosynthesis/export protein
MKTKFCLLFGGGALQILCLVILLGSACPAAAQQSSDGAAEPLLQDRYPRYRLRPGDVIVLSFPFTPEFNQTLTIQPDGYINLRGAGDVRLQDKTTPEVVESVRAAYAGILREPVITVELKEFEKPYFIVGGEVGNPGKYDFRGDTTLIQAVAMAGGFNDRAKTSEVLLFRRVSDEWAEVRKIDLNRMLRDKDATEDLHLKPGDMVLVPKSRMAGIARFIPLATLAAYFSPLRY